MDIGTKRILAASSCQLTELAMSGDTDCDFHVVSDDFDPRLDVPLSLDEAAPELEYGMTERQHKQRAKTIKRKKRMFRP